MKKFRCLTVVAVILLAAVPVAASTIALGTITHTGFTSMQTSQWGAQVFTLTSPLELAAFEVGFVHTTGFTSRATRGPRAGQNRGARSANIRPRVSTVTARVKASAP
jgi:hypothetical protein